ncbi:DNA alkylation repair protein [Patescibacteria group bacterium]
MKAKDAKMELAKFSDTKKIKVYSRFFKTGRGEYGEGDQFIGVTVPNCRRISKKYSNMDFVQIEKLLYSPVHEERLTALLILVDQFEKGDKYKKNEVFEYYIKHKNQVNNWDLVDLSAYKIVGAYLDERPRKILYKLAGSNNLWDKRISIISTFWFILHDDFCDTLAISEMLIEDKHDLIHKAVGWMLREVGKKDLNEEEIFLKKHYKIMPRTCLRYAIEKFPEFKRRAYLDGTV